MVASDSFRVRWAFNVTEWQPDTEQFDGALAALPQPETEACTRFHRHVDCKRALVSRLLQRKLGAQVFDAAPEDVHILRTPRGKPYFAQVPSAEAAPYFNFNVSHEGDWVLLVAEPLRACGVDVAAPDQLRFQPHLPLLQRLRSLPNCFADAEFAVAEAWAAEGDVHLEHYFRHLWAAKEAVLKARGDGLTYPPCQLAFTFPFLLPLPGTEVQSLAPVQAQLSFQGTAAPQWDVQLSLWHGNHIIGVATAPPCEILDQEITQTFAKPVGDSQHEAVDVSGKHVSFSILTEADLPLGHAT